MVRRLAVGATDRGATRSAIGPLPWPRSPHRRGMADVSHAAPQVAKALRRLLRRQERSSPGGDGGPLQQGGVPVHRRHLLTRIWPTWDGLGKIYLDHDAQDGPRGAVLSTRIYGDRKSALVVFTDTPELFGREMDPRLGQLRRPGAHHPLDGLLGRPQRPADARHRPALRPTSCRRRRRHGPHRGSPTGSKRLRRRRRQGGGRHVQQRRGL